MSLSPCVQPTSAAHPGCPRGAGSETPAAKAHRYVAELHEIATTQASAGLPAAVFDAIAEAYAAISRSPV